jgi:hypothetical protein
MKLDPNALVVDSFEAGLDTPSYAQEPTVDTVAGGSRYCSLVNTCATCWTDCPCA